MARDSLLDFFEDFAERPDTFLVHDDGYRVRRMSYREVAHRARAFAGRLVEVGIDPGDRIVIWSENRTEWVIALWAVLLAQAVIVPVDYRASRDLVLRIAAVVNPAVVLVGDEVPGTEGLPGRVWRIATAGDGPLPEQAATPPRQPPPPDAASPLAEIIFTSGATAEPKGVTITHRNVLANIIPIEREVSKYRKYAKPFHPLRFLNLLPLSHMFGQSMATFVPPMLSATVVFSHGYSPVEILRQIKSRRISVLVCVPKVLDVLRDHIERVAPIAREADTLAGKHWAWRWWRYRAIHRLFGWKFWCLICGAAPLDPALEAFWRKLGFLVVQGYGLTEAAPIVTLNHPMHASRGTVGTPIGGVNVQIAADGEILVRGDNVTGGYYVPEGQAPTGRGVSAEPGRAFEDGWFHTGDIGEMDAAGRLLIKGRKKEMIVTPQGLNVFPEDVERALGAEPGVKEAGVVGRVVEGEERVHAVLVLEPGADADAIVRGANAHLEDHQRVWSTSIWPGDALPRTEGTQKLKRRDLQRWVAGESLQTPGSPAPGTSVAAIVGRYAGGREVAPATTLEALGLSSLDRVEMMMALEDAFQTTLDESAIVGSITVAGLETLVRSEHASAAGAGGQSAASSVSLPAGAPNATNGHGTDDGGPIRFPAWNQTRVAWLVRRLSLPTWILPLGRVFMKITVEGLGHVAGIQGPVIFAANHQSHMDTPAILLALPSRWRYHVAPAMAKEFFRAHFNPDRFSTREWFTNSLNYYLACEFFNAFPLPQREAGTRQTLRYIGEMTSRGESILIFPEGRRSEDDVARFMPGVGMIAARLGVPVVPVRIEGLDVVLHPSMRFPKRGPVRIAFGAPLTLDGDDYPALAARVEDAVRALGRPKNDR